MVVPTPIPIPDSLIYYPCDAIPAGNTESSLAKGYVYNTLCLYKYKSVLESISEYNKTLKNKSGEKNNDK